MFARYVGYSPYCSDHRYQRYKERKKAQKARYLAKLGLTPSGKTRKKRLRNCCYDNCNEVTDGNSPYCVEHRKQKLKDIKKSGNARYVVRNLGKKCVIEGCEENRTVRSPYCPEHRAENIKRLRKESKERRKTIRPCCSEGCSNPRDGNSPYCKEHREERRKERKKLENAKYRAKDGNGNYKIIVNDTPICAYVS